MKTFADLVLLIAALSSVFFVASLADVPRRVRFSVATIGPSFLLTFLLHLSIPDHVDLGLTMISLSLVSSGVFGFQYTHTAPLTKDVRTHLIKRFALLFALSAIAVAIVATIIVKLTEQQSRDAPTSQTTPKTATPVVPADSTQQAITDFKRYSR